jgi:F-type H+-transporting ATPase subunit b
MQIDWWTLVFQGINFLILVWLLHRFLYRPATEVIARRKQLAERALEEAKSSQQDADAARRHYEDDREHLLEERREIREHVYADLEAERTKILEEAKSEARALVESARTSVAREREAAMSALRAEILRLAGELAARVLEPIESPLLDTVFLERAEAHLKGLAEEERERLQRDLAENGARLSVVTATPLAKSERSRWQKRLGDVLGHGEATEFSADSSILGGVELRFPHAVLKLTWDAQLKHAIDTLSHDEEPS